MNQLNLEPSSPSPDPPEWTEFEWEGRRLRWAMGEPEAVPPEHWPPGFLLEFWHLNLERWAPVRLWRTTKAAYDYLCSTNQIEE